MEIKFIQASLSIYRSTQLKLIMKVFVFLCCSIVFALGTNKGEAQKATIKIDADKTLTVKQAFRLINKQTDYKFIYRHDLIKAAPDIELKEGVIKAGELLDKYLSPINFTYNFTEEGTIIVKSKPTATNISTEKSMLPEAMQIEITGTIKDENGNALPGASILEKGTSNGTQTDLDGNFSIEVADEDAILVISFIGFSTLEIPINGQTVFSIILKEDAAGLDEVVVVGYGTVKKSDLTGSVSKISATSFEDQPISRIEQGLQGRASGVTVQQNSGQPGGEVRIRVRGANSITGSNAPLIVIDNIIGGSLTDLNPNDIASIEVLKDASATAIYGSRGSNGVILVSTKKGKGKTTIDVNYFASISSLPNKIDLLNAADFARVQNVTTPGMYSEAEISDLATNGGTDWQDELYRVAITQNAQVSASGREGKINYFLSGGYLDQEGVLITTKYNRLNTRGNFTIDFNEKFKLGLNIFGSRARAKNNVGSTGNSALVVSGLTWDPTTPVRDDNGDYNNLSIKSLASTVVNPVAHLEQLDNRNIDDRFNLNLNLSYDLFKNFNYTAVAGYSTINATNEKYEGLPNRTSVLPPRANFLSGKSTAYQVSNILTWDKDFGNHGIKLTGVYEFSNEELRSNNFGANDFLVPSGYYLLELSGSQSIGADFIESSIESYMGRGEYNYNDQLFVTGTIRVDKSSRFRPDKNTGTFPSVALAYSFANSSFVANSSLFSNIKFRAGWGKVGNQDVGVYSTWPSVLTGRDFSFNGVSLETGVQPGNFGNADLTWETTNQTNIGVDLSFWDRRLDLSIDVYKKNTTDLLLSTPVPLFAGGGSIPKNVGEVENKGIDVSLSGVLVNTDRFKWETNFNLSTLKNKVVSLSEGQEFITGNFVDLSNNTQLNRVVLGEPLGTLWGPQFLGTWKTSEAADAALVGAAPGDAKYLRDGDGAFVNTIIGNGMPTLTWGFNNSISYMNWDLNLFIRGVHGNDILNTIQGKIVGGASDVRSSTSPQLLNAWTPTNETEIPVAGSLNFTNSSRYVESGAYVRISNLSLGYTLNNIPGVENAKINLSAQNLLTLTDFTGYDPEVSSADSDGNGDGASGINVGAYPNPRVFTLGIKLGF